MTVKQKQHLLAYLGYYEGTVDGIWGQLSKDATKDFQDSYGGLTVDGDPGPDTQAAMKDAVARDLFKAAEPMPENKDAPLFWDGIQYFTREEFKCQCYKYTRYCDGYPAEMQELVVQICERVRRHFGKPITIISGLRCEKHNAAPYVKGVKNSQHMYGEAADIYDWSTAASNVLAYLNSQPDVRYAYIIPGTSNIHFDIQPVGR